jgi:integrase
LSWSAYDGGTIRLKQSKTGARVCIPVGAPLKAALDAAPRESPVILLTSEGKPWTPDRFRASFAKARAKAGIDGVTFNDLRGTAVMRLALAGATEAEIATITGHSLRDVRSILDSNYLHAARRSAAPPSTSSKKEQIFPTELPTAPCRSGQNGEKALQNQVAALPEHLSNHVRRAK